MGYYQEGFGTLTIKAANIDAALAAVRELNARHDLKRGGRYPATEVKPETSTSLGDPNVWFSWMPWDYDTTYTGLPEVMDALGFVTDTTPDGDLQICGFGAQSGCEDVFLDALAPYIEPGEYHWEGEDGHKWRDTYTDGRRIQHVGTVIYQ